MKRDKFFRVFLLCAMECITGYTFLSPITEAQNSPEKSMEYYVNEAPFKMPEINLPTFPKRKFNITSYGATGHGRKLNTNAIQEAIDACSRAGGGSVIVPPGLWLTGPIELKSHINFHLSRGAVLLFSKNHSDYPIIKAPHSSNHFIVESPVYGHDLTDVAITGSGVVDGSGETWRPVKKSKVTAGHWHELLSSGGYVSNHGRIWWPSKSAFDGGKYIYSLYKSKKHLTAKDFLPARDAMRPYMIYLIYSKNILIDGPTFKDSPKFALYPKYCENLVVRHIKINNEYWAQNGDGLDIASSRNVILYDNTVTAGDDGICMKSSPNKMFPNGPAMKNVIIADCVVYHGHGGFVIGSNTDGGMDNIFVTNCDFIGTDKGLRFKSRRGRGALVHNIYVQNIYMSNIVTDAIFFNTYYELSGNERNTSYRKVNARTPIFSDFHISHIYCDGANTAVSITGLPEMPVKNISLSDIRITAKHGYYSDEAENISLNNVDIIPEEGPVYAMNNSRDIRMNNVGVPKNFKTFLEIKGKKSSGIKLINTNLKNPKQYIQTGPDVSSNAYSVNSGL